MYPVSAEYISAMEKGIQRHKFAGFISGTPFTMEDVLRNSMTLSDQCSDSADLSLGGVFIGTLKFTLLNDLGFRRGSWKDREISLFFSMLINEEENLWEEVPVGVFTIAEALHTEKGIEIKAYTAVSKLDIIYPSTATNGNVYDIINLACTKCGVEFGSTRVEVENMPNGTVPLAIYPENNCKTWRDVVHYAAQIVGGFVTADRQGRIVLRRFGNDTGFSFNPALRFTGSKFSDFTTNYTAVTVENMTDGSLRTKKLAPNNGITLELGENPLFQYGTEDTLGGMLTNILQEAHSVAYVPFNSSMVGNPAFDLGDLITYTGGVAGTSCSCCIMSYTWKFNNSYAVKGFGKDPNLANAMSKAEKASGGGGTSGKGDTLTFLTYENAAELTVGSNETIIANLNVTNIKETFVDFWIELKATVDVDIDQAAVLTFRYSLDGINEVYRPVVTFNHSGVYTFNLHYYWLLETILRHVVNIYLEVSGGTVEIDVADLHAVLTGQGLATEDTWDGTITVSDFFSLESAGETDISFTGGEVIVHTAPVDHRIEISDIFGLVSAGETDITFIDNPVNIITRTNVYNLVTQDGRPLVTQDGRPYITNGGSD